MPQPWLYFCLGATYVTLPSLSNLYRWLIAPEAVCFLGSKQVCSLAHILGACRVALQQGRFTFRHDAVLWFLVSSIKSFLTSYQVSKTKFSYIKFVKAGSRLPKTSKKNKLWIATYFTRLGSFVWSWVYTSNSTNHSYFTT